MYSGDTSAVGELAEDTPTEWADRAGEYDCGDGEAGVVSGTVNSCSLSVEDENGRLFIYSFSITGRFGVSQLEQLQVSHLCS